MLANYMIVPGSCDGGGSNVVENVESSYSWNRGIWVQSQKLVVSGGKYHHNDLRDFGGKSVLAKHKVGGRQQAWRVAEGPRATSSPTHRDRGDPHTRSCALWR